MTVSWQPAARRYLCYRVAVQRKSLVHAVSGGRPVPPPKSSEYAAIAAEFRERAAKASDPKDAAFYARIAQGHEILASLFPFTRTSSAEQKPPS
jgi:hypothetical protein